MIGRAGNCTHFEGRGRTTGKKGRAPCLPGLPPPSPPPPPLSSSIIEPIHPHIHRRVLPPTRTPNARPAAASDLISSALRSPRREGEECLLSRSGPGAASPPLEQHKWLPVVRLGPAQARLPRQCSPTMTSKTIYPSTAQRSASSSPPRSPLPSRPPQRGSRRSQSGRATRGKSGRRRVSSPAVERRLGPGRCISSTPDPFDAVNQWKLTISPEWQAVHILLPLPTVLPLRPPFAHPCEKNPQPSASATHSSRGRCWCRHAGAGLTVRVRAMLLERSGGFPGGTSALYDLPSSSVVPPGYAYGGARGRRGPLCGVGREARAVVEGGAAGRGAAAEVTRAIFRERAERGRPALGAGSRSMSPRQPGLEHRSPFRRYREGLTNDEIMDAPLSGSRYPTRHIQRYAQPAGAGSAKRSWTEQRILTQQTSQLQAQRGMASY
ncbi:hypothetical protein CALCODRAFT_144436 [Calocera cornea HHB12733]|uniref:Uncharacterized protein n=1 Tax=Calocera cornea HHB12733 TaxID=1353952 RepID=A0A165CSQ9_9BASI|nr:hypothetical protein CALCODRAFT_144436 [Calocera cornea HHB12733]